MASPSSSLISSRKTAEVQTAWDAIIHSRFDVQRAGATSQSETLALLDLELDVLHSSLSLALGLRNAQNAACRLPVEVLSGIFALAQTDWHPQCLAAGSTDDEKKDPDIIRYTAGWMVVTRVCSKWRQAALSSPSLWCDVHCLSLHPDSASEMLSRSSGLKISMRVDTFDRPAYQLDAASEEAIPIWLCPPILRRTRQLTVTRIPERVLEACLPFLCTHMPSLEGLNMYIMGHRGLTLDDDGDEEEEPTDHYLPAEIFAGRCSPNFQSIHLDGRCVPWTSPMLSNTLTKLSLVYRRDYYEDAVLQDPPMSQLLELIRSLEGLRELSLQDVIPTNVNAEHFPTVKLPSSFELFEFITYTEEYAGDLDIFTHLELPKSSAGRVIPWDVNGTSVEDVTRALADVFKFSRDEAVPLDMHLSQYDINVHPTSSLLHPFYAPGDNGDYYNWFKYGAAHGTRYFSTCQAVSPPVSDYISLLSSLTSVHRLRVASDFIQDIDDSDQWINVLSGVRELRCITLPIFDAYHFLNAMCETEDGLDAPFALFPYLETLVLHEGGGSHVSPSSPKIKGLDFALTEAVRVRQASRSPLREILVEETEGSEMRSRVWAQLEGMVKVSFFP